MKNKAVKMSTIISRLPYTSNKRVDLSVADHRFRSIRQLSETTYSVVIRYSVNSVMRVKASTVYNDLIIFFFSFETESRKINFFFLN